MDHDQADEHLFSGVRHPRPSLPPTYAWVVYTLHDEEDRIIYVGMSGHFRARLRAHRSRTPDWTHWNAEEMPHRQAADEYEADLIRTLQPRLNVAGR